MKKSIWIVAIIIIIVLIGVAVNKSNNQSADKRPIKIGSIAALTGVGAAIGEEEFKGAKLAVDEANQSGGLNGRKIELISEDVSIDKLKNAGTVANKLISIDKVVAIVGPQWDEPALAILPIIEAAKVPMIGPNTTDTIETNGLGKYLFSTWYDNRVGVLELLKFVKSKNWKKITIIRPLDAGFWKFASDEFVKRAPSYGIEIADDINIGNPLAMDYRTFITKAKQKNPNAIFFLTSDPGECVFLKQIKELGLNAPLLSTESAGNNASLEACPADMENLYFSTPAQGFPEYQAFKDAFKQAYGKEPAFPSAVTAYDGIRVLIEALKKTNGEGGEKLQQALSETKDFKGASLPVINFKENGFVITPDNAFEMQTVKAGKFVKI